MEIALDTTDPAVLQREDVFTCEAIYVLLGQTVPHNWEPQFLRLLGLDPAKYTMQELAELLAWRVVPRAEAIPTCP